MNKTRRSNQIRSSEEIILSLFEYHDDEVGFEEWCAALLTTTTVVANTDTSPTFESAMLGPFKKVFLAAIEKEYQSLEDNKVFQEVDSIPHGFTALGTKMVLKIKETAEESMARNFKARLCGKGFKQVYGIDFHETFSPVANYDSLRIFITLLVMLDFEID
jgi:hypothetical protein